MYLLNLPLQVFLISWILGAGALLPESTKALDTWYISWSRLPVAGEVLHFFYNRAALYPPAFSLTTIAMSIILLLELNTTLQRFFSSRLFQFLGKYSFAFYCIHFMLIRGPLASIRKYLQPLITGNDSKFIHGLLTFSCFIIYMTPICLLFHVYSLKI
jgi:peptidoglycan/LPS O-acetylase OafA/YrhL